MTRSALPRLAITMGDPAGVGPEVIAGCWSDPRIHSAGRLVVIGDPETLKRAIELRSVDVRAMEVNDLESAWDATDPRTMPCLPVDKCDLTQLPLAQVSAAGGDAAYRCVVAATRLAQSGEADGIVTAPLSKGALHAAGHFYPGHTELLAEMCGVREFAMMLYLPAALVPRCPHGLGVVHVTLHMALRDVFENLTTAAVLEKIHLAQNALAAFGAQPPRIAVAALNPHAGEEGLFGDEESQIIAPAVEEARAVKIEVTGPFPTDTLMVRARDGEFDAVVAMYHDQGHIALKLLGMHGAVNVTLGLPIVRTSVAHGTAFDRAWQGTAETSGMVAAIETAALLARKQQDSGDTP
jgi:4-phospho-D-threonate 3-dehydrogenase / 4-phospho-D-erythronate 3-dehydrogenase